MLLGFAVWGVEMGIIVEKQTANDTPIHGSAADLTLQPCGNIPTQAVLVRHLDPIR